VFRNRRKSEDAATTLTEISFFEGFTPDELERVAVLADGVDVEQGAVLIDQGKPGQECFVILDGEAGVFVRDDLVATLGPGSMVGEMALIDHRPRSATVVAQTDMRVLSFDTKSFRTLLDEMPKAREQVMSLLNARLEANQGR